MHRRHLLQNSVMLAALASCGRKSGASTSPRSMAELIDRIRSGKADARSFLSHYLKRIAEMNTAGPELRAVIELHAQANQLPVQPLPQGSLHGAPILIKDNIETANDGMLTTAGSLALMDAPPPLRDAFIVQKLREAGALIFGKTNLSEWANIRSHDSTSGWSARGGLTRNPHRPTHNASGSSSGSAAAVAADFCAAAIGTETNGSIVSPASACGIVGLKPTVGKVSRTGIIPITHWQDTAGPMTHTARDAALLMNAISAHDPEDALSTPPPEGAVLDHLALFGPDVLKGKRLGILRGECGRHPGVLTQFERMVLLLKVAGAVIVEDVEIPNHETAGGLAWRAMLTEFRTELNAYLEKRGGKVRSLTDLMAFNEEHRAEEMPHFGQDIFEEAESRSTAEAIEKAAEARAMARHLAGPEGIDAAMAAHKLDALICPTNDPSEALDLKRGDADTRVASTPAAVAGYPHLTVPMGLVEGMPVGFSFLGAAWSEPLLLAMGDAFEKLRD
ncbi:MAG: amidase [Verrucomicrobiota bacterium]